MSGDQRGVTTVPAAACLVPALVEPVIAIARDLAAIELAPVAGRPGPAWRRVVFLDGGTRSARLVLAFDERLERRLRVELYTSLGLTLGPGEEDEALAELGNCFMGHIDGRLAGLGLELAFSIPGIAPGVDVPGAGEVLAAAAMLGSAEGAMGIALYLQTTIARAGGPQTTAACGSALNTEAPVEGDEHSRKRATIAEKFHREA